MPSSTSTASTPPGRRAGQRRGASLSAAPALPEHGLPPEEVVDELATALDGGVLGSAGGRFFGWVIGGALPAAVAADWLTVAWDQNAAIYRDVAGGFGRRGTLRRVADASCSALPAEASFALVTGCQMAHVTALAAARQHLLAARGIDAQRAGLAGAPPVRVLASELRHATIDRALRLLGIGTDAIVEIQADDAGRISLPALEAALDRDPERADGRLPAGRRAE